MLIKEFTELGAKAKHAASEELDYEAALGDIPDEFLDPIQVCRLIYISLASHVHNQVFLKIIILLTE